MIEVERGMVFARGESKVLCILEERKDRIELTLWSFKVLDMVTLCRAGTNDPDVMAHL
jgi:hypothetical protein